MPVAELFQRMSSEEVGYWQAYERVTGPLGQERSDMNTALVAERITALGGSKRKHKLTDFVLQWDRKKTQTPHEQKNILKALTAKFGGTFQ